MDVCLVWAQARNRAIGRANALPWSLPEDLAFFKALTMGSPIIMGRKTWESIGRRALPGRLNVVVSSSSAPADSRSVWAPSLEEALHIARLRAPEGASGIYVIGGSALYSQALQHAARVYITHVDIDVPDADAFAPELPAGMFGAPVAGESLVSAECLGYRFCQYSREPALAARAKPSPR